jgi:16S rRNA (cytosine967-C5)-methyltransferase
MIQIEDRVPLWRQLQSTASVIQAVRAGLSGTAAIDEVPSELRPGVQALAFLVWRNLGRAEALRQVLAAKSPPPAADALLCVALALAWCDADAPYDAHTLVNQTVEAAKRTASAKAQANFVNACLRRFLRERGELVARTDADPVALWNHPKWWIERVQRERPLQWQEILTQANTHAPMTLRVNARKTNTIDYLQTLLKAGIAGRVLDASAIILQHPVPVQSLPGFEDGLVSVQDAAAQLAAPLLLDGGAKANVGLRILDACAAPGGKTGHLLELTGGEVTALEVDPRRCARINQNIARLGLSARVITADVVKPQDWWDGQPYDAVLLDAPCTASGIVRRHPDVRWLRRESDIGQLAALQQKMMQTLWPMVRPGGRLLYCTCSIFLAEGGGQVKTFLAHNTDARLLPSPGHILPGTNANPGDAPDNQPGDYDGFYYALFQKQMA